jgi:hypothetical protein
MRLFALSMSVLLALGLSAPRSALAESGEASSPVRHPYFIGVSGGVGWVNPSYEGIAPQSLVGASIGVYAGYALTPKFTLGLEFTTIEKDVARLNAFDPFSASLPRQSQAGCSDCEPPATGGWVPETSLFFGNLAPRVEFSPLGESGPYVGASAGLALLQLVNLRPGFGGGLRAGYRVRVVKILDFGVEAGAQGQAYALGSALMISGSAVFRPHI